MGHHRSGSAGDPRLNRAALLAVVPLVLVTLAGLVWLWPHGSPASDTQTGLPETTGQVTSIDRAECEAPPAVEVNGCGTATVRLEDGSPVQTILPNWPGAPRIDVGDDVVLVISDGVDGASEHDIVDHQRGGQLWLLGAAFCAAVVAFGRWRGAAALAGLAVTFAVVLWFIAPAILAGESPLLVAVVGAAAIMFTVLYLTHGFSATTTVALAGTFVAFVLTALLSVAAVGALRLTGVTDDLTTAAETTHFIDMRGLLAAGIVIGALGVLDDVTITQAVTVEELARANPGYGARELYLAGSRVGRSHIASVVNTIVLAYAGASLPMLVLTVATNDSLADVVAHQFIAQEIVRSVVATLGLIAAVPVTTGLAALVARGRPREPEPA